MRLYSATSSAGAQPVPTGQVGSIEGIIVTAGAAATIITFYDGGSAAGRILYQAKVPANTTFSDTRLFTDFFNGVFVQPDANIAWYGLQFESQQKFTNNPAGA